jgi:hypothetical protein
MSVVFFMNWLDRDTLFDASVPARVSEATMASL